MGNTVLLGKLVLAIVGGVAAMLFVRSKQLQACSERSFCRFLLLGQIVSRLGLFFAVFVVAKIPAQSDVLSYYSNEVSGVLHHLIPFRDFNTAYGPLFPYIASLPVMIWNSPKSLILFSAVLDVICLLVWYRAGKACLDERTVRIAALLYMASPLVLVNVALNGQNQVWLELLIGGSVLLQFARRDFLSGLLAGVGLVSVKFLGVLFVPALFLRARNRTVWALGFLLPSATIYGSFYYFVHGLRPMLYFSHLRPSSGNVFYWLTIFGLPFDTSTIVFLSNLSLVVALIAVFSIAVHRFGSLDGRQLLLMFSLIMFVLLALSRKSLTTYSVIAFFPICVLVALAGRAADRYKKSLIAVFALFNLLALLEPSLWFRTMKSADLGVLRHGGNPFVAVFFLWETALLGFYLYYSRAGWLLMARPSSATANLVPISTTATQVNQ